MKLSKYIIFGQVGVIIFLLAMEAVFALFSSYRYVGFERRQGSWHSIAQEAQAENWLCQAELDSVKEAVREANIDILSD